MRSTVVVLALLLASGCGDDDGSAPAGGTMGTGDDTGVGDVASPDGSTGADDTGDSSGGLIIPDDDDGSTGDDDPEGFAEGFEDVLVGEQPGMPWLDIVERIEAPTVPSPTATVIDTTDAAGESTHALQVADALGTSQGIFAQIEPNPYHRISARVRIDQVTDATGGDAWSIAVGLLQDLDGSDPSEDPHVIVQAHADGTWHLRIKNAMGLEPQPALDMVLPFPEVELTRWYEVSLEAQTETGSFRVELRDPVSGELLGDQTALAPTWDEDFAVYDAVAFFDGEYGSEDGTQGGQASVDDIEYRPSI